MTIKVTDILSVCGFALGTGAFVVSLVDHHKTKEMASKIGVSVDRLKDMTEVEVPEQLIKTTVNNKVDKIVTEEVRNAAVAAAEGIKEDARKTIHREVDKAVTGASEHVKEDVKEEYEKQVQAHIDIQEFAKEIERDVKKSVESQVKGTIEGLGKMYTDKISSELSAYSNIGKVIKGVAGL